MSSIGSVTRLLRASRRQRRAALVTVCLVVWTLALLPDAPAQIASRASAEIERAVATSLHGADGRGKDGPMAKLSRPLIRLYHAHRVGGADALSPTPTTPSGLQADVPPVVTPNAASESYVRVDAVAGESGAALQSDLERLGLTNAARVDRMVSGSVPIRALDAAAALSSLRSMRPAWGGSGTGSVTSQGDVAQRSDLARANVGVDGSGVKACVLADSYDVNAGAATTAADDIASADLPGAGNPEGRTTPVDVVEESAGGGIDEGRAMLQIVHDVAPGASLGFHTSLGGQANYAQGVSDLVAANCDVLMDDYIYFAEPMFQDGVVAQAIQDAVATEGVTYLSFAGNAADRSYESAFRDSGQDAATVLDTLGATGALHDFDPGPGVDVRQQVTLPPGRQFSFVLQWDQPWFSLSGAPGASTDLDVYLLFEDEVVTGAQFGNVGNDPVEVITVTNGGSSALPVEMVIAKPEGPAPDRMKWVSVLNAFAQIDDFPTGGATTYGHRNVSEAITVGASAWFNTPRVPPGSNAPGTDPPILNAFSSKGGVPILFDEQGTRLDSPEQRGKPDVTAPDGGNTTFFGNDTGADSDTAPNFFGTSAATPHAGGVVALMLEADPTLTPPVLRTRLQDSAIDIVDRFDPLGGGAASIPDGVGADAFSGAGLIQADAADPLPVALTGFDARVDGSDVVLSWRTASEENNGGFGVTHRAPDASDFVAKASLIEGAGTTARPQRYEHRVEALEPGTHAFRLVQVDLDGTTRVAAETSVDVALSGAFSLSRPAPHPIRTRGTMRLQVRTKQHVRATLFDALGRRVNVLWDATVTPGDAAAIDIDGRSLGSGAYFVRIEGDSFHTTERVTIVR